MLVKKSRFRKGEQEFCVSLSIGTNLIREKDMTNSLLERADQLLYKSKGGGRNRVTLG